MVIRVIDGNNLLNFFNVFVGNKLFELIFDVMTFLIDQIDVFFLHGKLLISQMEHDGKDFDLLFHVGDFDGAELNIENEDTTNQIVYAQDDGILLVRIFDIDNKCIQDDIHQKNQGTKKNEFRCLEFYFSCFVHFFRHR